MNQNWQEKRMRQLYRELREQDDQHTPSFASVLESALTNQKQAKSGWPIWRLAVAMFMLVILAVLFFIKPFSSKPTLEQRPDTPIVSVPLKNAEPTPAPPESYAGAPRQPKLIRDGQNRNAKKAPSLYARHKSLTTQALQPAMLISKWQSPTAGLLKTPGAELFKTIPQVGEPLVEMKRLFPEEKN